ncbi:UNVERIFIED_CONTAM: hypothetical protein LBW93_01410, partial [Wolbachia endosymbiont of Nasonia longicornis]
IHCGLHAYQCYATKPVRHWDPVKFTSIKVINVSDDGKMDPSVSYLDDIIIKISYSDDKKGLLA